MSDGPSPSSFVELVLVRLKAAKDIGAPVTPVRWLSFL